MHYKPENLERCYFEEMQLSHVEDMIRAAYLDIEMAVNGLFDGMNVRDRFFVKWELHSRKVLFCDHPSLSKRAEAGGMNLRSAVAEGYKIGQRGLDALEDSTRRLERSGISAGITPWSATEPLAYVSFAKPSDRTIGQTQVASWCVIIDDDDVECIDRRLKKFCQAAPADRNGSAKTSDYSGELDSIKAALAAIGDVIDCAVNDLGEGSC